MSMIKLNVENNSVDIDLTFDIDSDIENVDNVIKNSEKIFKKIDSDADESFETTYLKALNEYKGELEEIKDNPASFNGEKVSSNMDGLGEGEYVYDGYSLKIEFPIVDKDIIIQNIKNSQNEGDQLFEKFKNYDLTEEDKTLIQQTFDLSNTTMSNINKGKDFIDILNESNYAKGMITAAVIFVKSSEFQFNSNNNDLLTFLNEVSKEITGSTLGKMVSFASGVYGIVKIANPELLLIVPAKICARITHISLFLSILSFLDLIIEDPIGSLDSKSTKIKFQHLAIPPAVGINLNDGRTIMINSGDMKTVLNSYIDIIDTCTVNMIYCLGAILEDRDNMINNAVNKTYNEMEGYAYDGCNYNTAQADTLIQSWNKQLEQEIFTYYDYVDDVDEEIPYEELTKITPSYEILKEGDVFMIHNYTGSDEYTLYLGGHIQKQVIDNEDKIKEALKNLIEVSKDFTYKVNEKFDKGDSNINGNSSGKQKLRFCDVDYIEDVLKDITYISDRAISNIQNYAAARDEMISLEESISQKIETAIEVIPKD